MGVAFWLLNRDEMRWVISFPCCGLNHEILLQILCFLRKLMCPGSFCNCNLDRDLGTSFKKCEQFVQLHCLSILFQLSWIRVLKTQYSLSAILPVEFNHEIQRTDPRCNLCLSTTLSLNSHSRRQRRNFRIIWKRFHNDKDVKSCWSFDRKKNCYGSFTYEMIGSIVLRFRENQRLGFTWQRLQDISAAFTLFCGPGFLPTHAYDFLIWLLLQPMCWVLQSWTQNAVLTCPRAVQFETLFSELLEWAGVCLADMFHIW